MSSQFEPDPSIQDQIAIIEASQASMIDAALQVDLLEAKRPGRFRAAIAAGSMLVAGLGASVFTAESAEAGGFNDEVYSPSVSFAEKAQEINAAGHRGLKGYYKGRKADEDTVRSCLHAVEAGADTCEIDLHKTKDGKDLVIHDADTGRVSRDCNLKVATHTLNRLKRCHTNHGDRFSSLSELAQAMSPYKDRVNIIAEIKDTRINMRQLRTINSTFAQYGFGADNLAYESFYGRNLRKMKAVAPDVRALKIDGSAHPLRASSLSSFFDGYIIPMNAFVNGESADPNFAEEYQAQGREIIPWGVETLAQMRYVINSGASGFMSDHVNRVNSLR